MAYGLTTCLLFSVVAATVLASCCQAAKGKALDQNLLSETDDQLNTIDTDDILKDYYKVKNAYSKNGPTDDKKFLHWYYTRKIVPKVQKMEVGTDVEEDPMMSTFRKKRDVHQEDEIPVNERQSSTAGWYAPHSVPTNYEAETHLKKNKEKKALNRHTKEYGLKVWIKEEGTPETTPKPSGATFSFVPMEEKDFSYKSFLNTLLHAVHENSNTNEQPSLSTNTLSTYSSGEDRKKRSIINSGSIVLPYGYLNMDNMGTFNDFTTDYNFVPITPPDNLENVQFPWKPYDRTSIIAFPPYTNAKNNAFASISSPWPKDKIESDAFQQWKPFREPNDHDMQQIDNDYKTLMDELAKLSTLSEDLTKNEEKLQGVSNKTPKDDSNFRKLRFPWIPHDSSSIIAFPPSTDEGDNAFDLTEILSPEPKDKIEVDAFQQWKTFDEPNIYETQFNNDARRLFLIDDLIKTPALSSDTTKDEAKLQKVSKETPKDDTEFMKFGSNLFGEDKPSSIWKLWPVDKKQTNQDRKPTMKEVEEEEVPKYDDLSEIDDLNKIATSIEDKLAEEWPAVVEEVTKVVPKEDKELTEIDDMIGKSSNEQSLESLKPKGVVCVICTTVLQKPDTFDTVDPILTNSKPQGDIDYLESILSSITDKDIDVDVTIDAIYPDTLTDDVQQGTKNSQIADSDEKMVTELRHAVAQFSGIDESSLGMDPDTLLEIFAMSLNEEANKEDAQREILKL